MIVRPALLAALLYLSLAPSLADESGAAFWGMHAAIIAGAGLVFLIARTVAGQLLAPVVDPEAENGPATAT